MAQPTGPATAVQPDARPTESGYASSTDASSMAAASAAATLRDGLATPGALRPGSRAKRAVLAAAAGVTASVTVLLVLAVSILATAVDDTTRSAVLEALGARAPLFALLVLACGAGAGLVASRLYPRWVMAPARLHEQAQLLLADGPSPTLRAPDAPSSIEGWPRYSTAWRGNAIGCRPTWSTKCDKRASGSRSSAAGWRR